MVKTVVVLGGSYGGLHVAHYLLKQKKSDVKVILVSNSSHFYWNMASVRAIVPGQIKDDVLFRPLKTAFERYPAESWELITGSAEKVDAAAKTVLVSGGRTISYDQLVLATGSRSTSSDVPWKTLDTYDATVAKLNATRDRVAAAQHIVVAGAGATGIEVAGELGYEFGKTKEITLLAAGPSVLDGDSVGPAARHELEKLHVKIKTDARVADVQQGADGKTLISLVNGESLTADLYLPTMGMKANAEMVDAKYLNEHGYVVVDDFYRVKGLEDVWAVGDVVSKPRGGFMITQKQAAGVAKNVDLALSGKTAQVVKLLPVDIMACSVGRNRGAGRMGSVKMFSVMVWLAKGKTLGIQRMPGYIDGTVA